MNDPISQNLTVLSNATEFAAAVVRKVAGEAVSTQVDGKRLSSTDLKNAIAAKLQSGLITEGGKQS